VTSPKAILASKTFLFSYCASELAEILSVLPAFSSSVLQNWIGIFGI